jgi:hypothetical protein
MRVSVYSQELSDDVEHVERPGDAGETFHGVRFNMRRTEHLHEDDQSGVTFWLPRSPAQRRRPANAFRRTAEIFENPPTPGSVRDQEVEAAAQRLHAATIMADSCGPESTEGALFCLAEAAEEMLRALGRKED